MVEDIVELVELKQEGYYTSIIIYLIIQSEDSVLNTSTKGYLI